MDVPAARPYYAVRMSGTGLPARIVYAVVSAPLACAAGFYLGVFVLTRAVPAMEGIPQPEVTWANFVISIFAGFAVGFSVFFYALTLPRLRLRRRGGRAWRMAASAVLVLMASVMAEAEGVSLWYTAALMLWISVTLTFTFIRYGVLDKTGRSVVVS